MNGAKEVMGNEELRRWAVFIINTSHSEYHFFIDRG